MERVVTFAWRVLRDEVRRVVCDPGVVLLMVVAVLVYALIYPTPYQAQVVRDVPIAVVDEDRSDLSRQLIRMVDTHPSTRVFAVVADAGEAERAIASGAVSGAMLVPRGLSGNVLRGQAAEVVAVSDATYFLLNKSVVTGIAQSVGTLSAGIEIRRLEAHGVAASDARRLRAPIRADLRPLFNPVESYTSYVVPAVFVLILHQTLLMGIGLVQGTGRERAARAARRIRFGAWRGFVSLGMRTLLYLALYAVHALVYFNVLLPRLGLPLRASLDTLAWFLLPFILAVTWLGMAVGALFRTRESAMAIVFGLSAPLLFSSGVAWPVEAMSASLREIVGLVPAIPGINGIVRLTQMGASRAEVFVEWQRLWILAFVYLPVAWLAEAVRPRASDDAAPGTGPGVVA